MQGLSKAPSARETRAFYDELSAGAVARGMWGMDNRFAVERIVASESVRKYFVDAVRPHISPKDNVLDVGCGPGAFLAALAPNCGAITGADISGEFVNVCKRAIDRFGLDNAAVVQASCTELPYPANYFDVVTLVDVLHHLDNIPDTIDEVRRVLKPGGRIIVFEPNKLNPLIYLLHALDPNERGLLAVGRRGIYAKLLGVGFTILESGFSGLVIGPESKAFYWCADRLSFGAMRRIAGWLNPKLIIVAEKN